jgi:hypothetical protein
VEDIQEPPPMVIESKRPEAEVKKPEVIDEEEEEETYDDHDEESGNIPGKGFMFAVKDDNLPEATRLTPKATQSYAVNYVQDEVLKTGRTKSVFELYSHRKMKLNISEDGQGRDELKDLIQLKTEEENSKGGDLFARPQ